MFRFHMAPESRSAFRHRSFALYWTAQLISYLGTFMQQVALGYLIYDLTGSKWLLGVIAALQMGPSLLLALPAGVLADRVQRRRLIMATQSTALLLAFSLATLIALHRLEVWEIMVISVLSGIAVAVEMPTRQAFVIDLVGKDDLPNAIAWNSLVLNGARVIGPAIGGVAIRLVGVAPIFYYNSVSFLAVIVALLLMRLPGNQRAGGRHPLADLQEGLRYLRNAPSLMLVLALVGVVATFTMNSAVIMPIFARDVLHLGADGLGLMWTALGVGAVVGSVTVVRWSRAAVAGPLLLVAAGGAGAAALGLSLSRVADHVRGRVLSVYSMIFIGTGPVGGLLTAALAGIGGAPLALFIGGVLCLTITACSAPVFLRQVRLVAPAAETTRVDQRVS